MFDKISKTGTGLAGIIIFVIVLGGQALGVPITETDAAGFAQNVVGAVGFLLSIWGQFSRKDLVGGFVRK